MYNLQDIKQVIGPFDGGHRMETRAGIVQNFFWECGCYAKRNLHDEPVEAKFCKDHQAIAMKRLKKMR